MRVNKGKLYKLLAFCALVVLVAACAGVKSSSKQKMTEDDKLLTKDYLLIEATKYASMGDLQSALIFVNQSIRYDSLCSACYYLKSSIYARGGRYQEASLPANTAAQLDTTNKWYALNSAQINAQAGNVDTAIVLYNELVDKYGYDPDVYMNLVDLYAVTKKYDHVKDLLDTIEKYEGYQEPVAFARQQLYTRQGENEKALAEAKALNDMSPNRPQYLTILAESYTQLNEFDQAKVYYSKAIEVDSTYLPAQVGQLDVYRRLGDYTSFFNGMQKVISNKRINLNDKLSYLSLVLSDPVLGQKAVEPVSEILAHIYPDYKDSWAFIYFYVSFLMQKGDSGKALEVMNAYVNETPTIPYDTWMAYLSLLQSTSQWKDLSDRAEEGMKRFKKDIPLTVYKAVGLWQLGDTKAAASALHDALKLKPDSTQRYDLYAMLGDLYHVMDDPKKSFECYDKALAINPDGIVVLNNYAYYLSERSERLDMALRMSKKVVEVEPNNPTYLDTHGWVYYKLGVYTEAKNVFRQAMVCGGRNQAVLLDHYADVLFALEEYTAAIVYWELALGAADCEKPDLIKEKIAKAKTLSN